ncbi:restriction endonuclease subunit S [Aliarcobacter cryaerophilus]|uniref:Restriction endonuclease subunit S n=1 Tax=Aliarcobacter cryaerophilus TaxID=28198 RepID=A0A7G9LNP4_9BACT|nr:restriction endonuclease subunit S [Aliarcobacter cryaerophilus]QNM90243.1 restriction endonuclease subunit S [Aliarcobacter cryaerophilus]
MKIEDKKWKEFFIGGENGIFDISSSSSGIDKNKLLLNTNKTDIPYITRTEENNGINLFIQKEQSNKYTLDEANVITIGLDTQTVFYQSHKFYTGQNIQVLRHKKLNKLNAKFLIPLIKIQMQKFNWGGNGATLGRLYKTKIMLPVDQKNNIDWQFMEQYTKIIINKKLNYYKKYAKCILDKLQHQEIESLNDKNWREFFLTDIFMNIQRGKRLIKTNQIIGDKPYISSTASRNGVDNFIGNNIKVRIFNNCLTIANSGSVGASFFHPYKFVGSDHITHLKNDNFNEFIYLFIATLTNRFSGKYNFNREINDFRISREKILLPINSKYEPDYKYMEQYIKNIKYKKVKQYLNYLDNI